MFYLLKVCSRLRNQLMVGAGLAFLLAAIPLSAYAIYTVEENNFHTVVSGCVYRSAQMNVNDLANCINKFGIKSILNLRGENSIASWHKAEIATASRLGVVHYDWGFGAGDELNVQKMNDLIALMRAAPKPILIHCQGGADRTGLASALYCYAVEAESPEISDRQLTVWYGHMPLYWLKERAMDHSFWRYVANTVSLSNTIPRL